MPNRKTGEFSAADMRRATAGRKPPKDGVGIPAVTKIPGRFICCGCLKEKADVYMARDRGGGRKICVGCVEKKTAISDGSFRTPNGTTHAAYKRNSAKKNAQNYRAGRLQKWMFS